MISRFFIDRPIFATVLSILIVLAGAAALPSLPIAQYPDVAPPTVVVSASYPGANARTVRDTVAAPIEQQVSGVENMLAMSSTSASDGSYTLSVTFKLGTSADMAQVLVQNRVSLALPVIPEVVQREGITVTKVSPSTLMIVNLVSTNPDDDALYLSNYATIQVRDELARVDGVGDVGYLGQRDYSMRIWLNPDRMAALELSTDDIVEAISQQNAQIAAGQIGQPPVPAGQELQLVIDAKGRLVDEKQFGDIIIKVRTDAAIGTASSVVRLHDVARIELGAQQYGQSSTLDGKPSVGLAVFALPGANALRTAEAIRARMETLKDRFPPGLDYRIVYDTTPFVRESIIEVFRTLRDAIVLVALVVLLFLQSWRAALIPLVAVPVAIIGTFAVMAAMGFSLNTLSLFGLVLAIGIVVDDAIVVAENVERWLEQGLSPRDAAVKAMEEVTGPVIAIALVLCAVFVPCAFIGGVTGRFFREFAVAIAVSTAISAFNSLTLSPALAALLLRRRGEGRDWVTRGLDALLGWFFRLFNHSFDLAGGAYVAAVGGMLRGWLLVLLLYGGLIWLAWWQFAAAPKGFVPEQDKGYLLVNVQLPDGASLERTRAAMAAIEAQALNAPGVAHTVSIAGESLALEVTAPNLGSMYVMLAPFDERRGHSANEIADGLRARFADFTDARLSVFGAPAIDGLGATGGFRLMIQDFGTDASDARGLTALLEATDAVVAAANQSSELVGVEGASGLETPWLRVDIDRVKCQSLGVTLATVLDTLQAQLGSYDVNNFNQFGRSWQVIVMGDAPFRRRIDDIGRLQVRGVHGNMVPLATLISVQETTGPMALTRFNMRSAAAVTGGFAPGASSGEAIRRVETIARETLPPDMMFTWTGLVSMQVQAQGAGLQVFALAIVFVFLVLAAQYESWRLPMAVILVAPMCLLCAVIGVVRARLDIDVFTEVGFVVLVGLASKNAILIVEFARQRRSAGASRREATLDACRLRLRPIVMTSMAFILGVVPLVLAQGAGAEMRRALGVAVFSGMIGVTLFGLLLTPVFFYVVTALGGGSAPVPTSPLNPSPNPPDAIAS
ncbi:MAG: multidrug efflux RND transporter permease subunit [Phycisphaerales bacterium]